MQVLPEALAALGLYRQFILWMLAERDGKQVKLPVDYRTASVGDAHNPYIWLDAQTAITTAAAFGDGYGVGFVFTVNDPFFFVDLDKCLEADNVTWSPVAMDVLTRVPGAAVEVSQSGRGLHIIGTGAAPEHSCKNVPLGLEFYTEGRFVALTGTNAIGDAGADLTAYLPGLVTNYFPPKGTTRTAEWSNEPVAEWSGPEDDDELIAKALASGGASNAFGGKAGFRELWEGNVDVLAATYPDEEGNRAYDGSSADAALAQHLAFWTGNNCDRMLSLMRRSGLVRDKWEREDYLVRTILRAVSLQDSFYTSGTQINAEGAAIAQQYGAPKLRASSDAQRNYADGVRAQKLVDCMGDEETIKRLCSSSGANASAKFWLDNQERTPAELVAMVTPIESAANPMGAATGPEIVAGHQYLGATLQTEHFKGCVYIQDLHRIFTPGGGLLKSEQFNATYGGYVFQLDETGDKTTRKAWEAFTESQVVRWPKANALCFRPALPTGTLIEEEGRILVNTYVPIETERRVGDVTPFLTHLAKVLPVEGDRAILLAYMAACIQYKGVKFQWAPLLQGAPGNGKTLFTRCVAFAVGNRYTHLPKAADIDNKFNAWLMNKLFIGVEDIVVPDHKREVIEALKPMITNDRIEMQPKGADQFVADNYANFILNMNPRDGLRKDRNDRRFCVFYTKQQNADDINADGMGGDYFPNLYRWLQEGGYAIVANYLATYQIPNELNPAGACHRAPTTSSTEEAVNASMGSIEQEILEAVEEGRPGFAGGWISSTAVERLLQSLRMGRAIPRNKRRELLESLGYEYHPALKDGRVNNVIAMDGGKPRLFIKQGHIHANLISAAEVSRHYQEAQGAPVGAAPAEVFGNE
jgi:hypothetical protein